jgi:hypothetical protein
MVKKRLLANLHGVKKCEATREAPWFFDVPKQESFRIAVVFACLGGQFTMDHLSQPTIEQAQIRATFDDGGAASCRWEATRLNTHLPGR